MTPRRVPGIPTLYNSSRFRSRLEAKWACFFDILGWRWDYEPFDLDGYIPDFLMIGFKTKLIVEVKPATSKEEMQPAIKTLQGSGWDGDAMVVGASPMVLGDEYIGLITQRREQDEQLLFDHACLGDGMPNKGGPKEERELCGDGNCLFTLSGGWTCYRCGVYCKWNSQDNVEARWREAGNIVQWNAKKRDA